jgi:hypothetical protein
MLSATSTRWAPWYVIPADRKWFARICVAAVLAHTLIEIDPQFPAVTADRRQDLLVVKGELEAQAPKGAPADPFAAKKAKKAKKEAIAQASKKAEAKAEASQVAEDGHRPDESPGQPARASRARGGAATQGQPAQVNPRTGRSRAKGQPS